MRIKMRMEIKMKMRRRSRRMRGGEGEVKEGRRKRGSNYKTKRNIVVNSNTES